MAEQTPSDIFSPPILDFLNTEGLEEDLDKLFEGLSEADLLLDTGHETMATPSKQAHTGPTHKEATFDVSTEADLQRYRDKDINRNTSKTTATWVNRFEAWRKAREISYKLEDIPESKLDNILQRFFQVQSFENGTAVNTNQTASAPC